MDEYINREAAIRALLNDCLGQVNYSREDAADCIRYMDAVPVVRCNDCKHLCVWNRKDMHAFCPKTNIAFLPFEQDTRTFFCGFGERKDGGKGRRGVQDDELEE